MHVAIFGTTFEVSLEWPWLKRRGPRRLSAEELKKIRSIPFPDLPELPFYCIVCREFRIGSCACDVEIGGWYCAHHPQEIVEKASLNKSPADFVYAANRQGEWRRCTRWSYENDSSPNWEQCDPPAGWQSAHLIDLYP